MNTKTISTGLVALLMIIMALAPGAMNVTELNDEIDTEYGHPQDADGTDQMSGFLSWQDDAWDASWTCEGGLALVTETNWQDFVTSSDTDPHEYTSWGVNLTGAGLYEIVNAPAGTWVVTAGLTCTDDAGVLREAGGQFGDDMMNPEAVSLEGVTLENVSFTLIEHGEGMGDDPMFICGNGTVISFGKVNNEIQDCDDGADEQQYDSNGTEINWFDCHGGTQVWIHQVNDGVADCPDGDDEMPGDEGDDCPFDPTVPGSPCDPVETNPCYTDGDSPECMEYVMEYCASNADDPGCDDMGGDGTIFVCGDGTEIPFDWINDGDQDCEDGADEQQYDVDGTEINWFDCHGGTQVWIHQVNDGVADCPDGDDEMHDDGGDDCPFDATVPGNPCDPVETNPCYTDHDSDECMESVMEYCASYPDDPGCDGMGGEPCPFMDVSGSPCEPVETNPCMADGESPECWDYVMEYCATTDDPACEDMGEDDFVFICGDGSEIPFDWVNDGEEDCEDGADEQQYDAADEPINWFDCYDGSQVWIHQVNDGTDDCPDGDDEMSGDGMDCNEQFIEFHLVTSEFGGVNFVFDMICELSLEQSDEYREMIDSWVGNGDGFVTINEVDDFMTLMTSCHDDDGTLIECDDSCYTIDEDGVETETDCESDEDEEEWSINGVVMEMHETDMKYDIDSVMSGGNIIMTNGMSSQHVDLVDGENTVTVKFENLNDDNDGGGECFEVQVLPSGDWTPTLVSVEPVAEWELSDIESGGHAFYGCDAPDTFTAVFEYSGDGHPNGIENLPPICEFKWFMANDTAFEEGNLVTEGLDGDVEIELGAGSYMISVWCKDAEMDFIQVKWVAPELNLTNEYVGYGEVNGWVMFIVPPGLNEEIVVPYKWISEEWEGNGEFHITLDSGEGDGGDVEGDGGGLPGFTSLMTITALLGAVFFLGRRESE